MDGARHPGVGARGRLFAERRDAVRGEPSLRRTHGPSGLMVQLPLTWDESVAAMQEAVHSFAVELGQQVATRLLEEEVERLCGSKHSRPPERTLSRHGHQAGFVVMAGQKLAIQQPRVRPTQRHGEEVELQCYALMHSSEAMSRSELARMVRGVLTWNDEGVVETVREGFGIQRSIRPKPCNNCTRSATPMTSEMRSTCWCKRFAGWTSSAPWLRTELASSISRRRIPELVFQLAGPDAVVDLGRDGVPTYDDSGEEVGDA